jgi:hypothetical protein
MIDTLMVLWTSGTWKRLLRTVCTILILFTCIFLGTYLITASGGRWSGLAITVEQPGVTPAVGKSLSVPTVIATTAPYVAPVILQNPIPTEVATPTPVSQSSSEQSTPQNSAPTEVVTPTHVSQSGQRQRSSRHLSRRRPARHTWFPFPSTSSSDSGSSDSGNSRFDIP